MAITMVVGFISTRIVLDELGESDYGIYFVVGGVVAIFSLLNASMSGATQRWITVTLGEGDQKKLNKVFAVGMTAQLAVTVIAVAFYEVMGTWYLENYAVFPSERAEAVSWVFQLSVIAAIIQLFTVPFLGAILAHEKMSALVYVAFIDIAFKLLVCVVLPFITVDKLIFYAAVIVASQLAQLIFYARYSRKFEEVKIKFSFDWFIFKDMWRLAMWSLSGNIAFLTYTQGLVLLVNYYFGPSVNAAGGLASQAINIVNQFRMNFQQAISPQIMKTFARGENREMETLVIRSSKFSLYLVVIFGIPLFMEANYLLSIWLKEVPLYTVEFLRAGLFVTMAMTVREPLITSAMASGDLKRYSLVVITLLMLILPISWLGFENNLSPTTGQWVAFLIISLAVLVSAYMLGSMTGLRLFRYLKQALLPGIVVTLLTGVVPFLLHLFLEEGFIRLALVSVVTLISAGLFAYLFGLDNGEQRYFKSIFIKMKDKTLSALTSRGVVR